MSAKKPRIRIFNIADIKSEDIQNQAMEEEKAVETNLARPRTLKSAGDLGALPVCPTLDYENSKPGKPRSPRDRLKGMHCVYKRASSSSIRDSDPDIIQRNASSEAYMAFNNELELTKPVDRTKSVEKRKSTDRSKEKSPREKSPREKSTKEKSSKEKSPREKSPREKSKSNEKATSNENKVDLSNTKRIFPTAIAEIEYEARDGCELTIKKGDIIYLRGSPAFGWCEGEVHGNCGWFPTYVCPELANNSKSKEGSCSLFFEGNKITHKNGKKEDKKEDEKQDEPKDGEETHENEKVVEKEAVAKNEAAKETEKEKEKEKEAEKAIEKETSKQAAKDVTIQAEDGKEEKDASSEHQPAARKHSKVAEEKIQKRERAEFLSNFLKNSQMIKLTKQEQMQLLDIDVSSTSTEIGISPRSSICEEDIEHEQLSIEEEAIELFATSPNKAIDKLIKAGIVKNTAQDIADYLFNANRLCKKMVGDYLGDHKDINKQVLSCYLEKLNFKDLAFAQALRLFLYSFKLPGEAQKIDRIMEAFAAKYYSQYSGNIFKCQDCVYILAFSTIMLNTDIHNPSVKHKMQESEFISNNKGINDGSDLPAVFLRDLYQSIVEDEIKAEEFTVFPHAEKRGFLFLEKKSITRKIIKYWCIIDSESDSLYCYKRQIDTEPTISFKLSNLILKEKQKPKAKRGFLFAIVLYTKNKKKEEVIFYAGSQRLWVDWLSLFTQLLKPKS